MYKYKLDTFIVGVEFKGFEMCIPIDAYKKSDAKQYALLEVLEEINKNPYKYITIDVGDGMFYEQEDEEC